jgi:flagellar motor switch protein FliN/FliY
METVSYKKIVTSIQKSLVDTFETMLSMDLDYSQEASAITPGKDCVVASVHFAGEVVGVMSLHTTWEFGRIIATAMLGGGEEKIAGNEEIKDVVGEIANIVAGNLKTDFMDAGLSLVLSTPSITRGNDFKIDPPDIAEPQYLKFVHHEHELNIDVYLKEEKGAKEEVSAVGETPSDEIIARINKVDIRTAIINSVIDVFYTMLSMEVEHISKVPDTFKESNRTVGTVSFAGDVDGIFNIQVNDNFGRIMTAAMLGIEEYEIESEEDVYDVIREVSNIIGGNLKSKFIDVELSCILSTPSITSGSDFKIEAMGDIKTEQFIFAFQDQTIIVEAGVRKQEGATLASAAEQEPEKSAPSQPIPTKDKAGITAEDLKNIGIIMEIPMELTVELGRTRKKISDLLRIGPDSVVKLEQLEGEPVDILINQTLIARGEVVVEKEKYGIRISQIVSRKERINSLH